jgi:methoxymalonate biosynthesis acyl carrier protein
VTHYQDQNIMSNNNVASKIGTFMSRAFEQSEIAVDEDIFAAGYTNSLFAMQLVDFVEREFGIEIESEDLEIDNFRTIGQLAALVERKLATARV